MKARVFTAAIGIPIVMAACFNTQPWFFGGIVVLCAVLGCMEIAQFSGRRLSVLGGILPMSALLTLTVVNLNYPPLYQVVAALLALFAVGVFAAGRPGQFMAELASLYVGAPMAVALFLQQTWPAADIHVIGTWHLRTYILLALIPLWIGDSAAIFAGKAWGKHPLAPKISPKKTWEGAIANFVGCILGALGVGYFLDLPVPLSLVSGAISGVLGQAGDLYESALKRKAGIKDSGTILPGHGGVLDRLDSLFATVIPIALTVYVWPK